MSPGQSVTILVVDDDEVDRMAVRRALRGTGLDVELQEAHDVRSGLEMLHKFAFDCALIDYRLPDGDGLELIRRVTERGAIRSPMILLTGVEDETMGVRAVEEGAQDYLVKAHTDSHALGRAIRYSIERKRLEEQLRQTQRLEAIGRLAGGIAHDFNNLLTAIGGYSELLMTSSRLSESDLQHVQEIARSTKRAAALTSQLLVFSRRQVVQPKAVNLNSIIGDMKGMLRRLIGEEIELRTHPDPSLSLTMVDPGQIGQVIMNLVVNARDAITRAGSITIETGMETLDAGGPTNRDCAPGTYVRLSVIDTGAGMDSVTLSRLFEPFYTTKPAGEGTGLGLSTVYGIVKQSRGYLAVASELGKGTRLDVCFPRTNTEPPSSTPELTSDRAIGGAETILLVEDDDQLRKLAATVLGSYGYKVIDAATPSAALAIAERVGDALDLVVTDVVMPGFSGRELVSRLTRFLPGIRVIYMSGYTEDTELYREVVEAGAVLLNKPFKMSELALEIRRILDAAQEAPN